MSNDNQNNTNGDVNKPMTIKARDLMENKDKIEYFEYEVNDSLNAVGRSSLRLFSFSLSRFQLQRYEAYADRLQRHFQQIQVNHPSLKSVHHDPSTNHEPGNHSFSGPLEAVSGVQNSSQPTHSQPPPLLSNRSATTIGYKKTSQSSTITMSNPNRYSYMMAVNTHPVVMKEHRL